MAQEDWTGAIVMFEQDRDSNYTTETDYNIGLCYAGLEDFNTALYHFEKALKHEPTDDRIINNATISFNKLYPDESWSHPYSGFTRMMLSLSVNIWMLITLVISLLLSFAVYSLVIKDEQRRNRNIVAVVFGVPLMLFTCYGVYETYNHSGSLDYLLPKNMEVTTYLTVDGLESDEKLKIGARYKIIAENTEWFRIKSDSSNSLWVQKSEVYPY
jgi:tetratricopeptide (TPR) repeat protein